MNKNSNIYTVVYAAVMVIVVAAMLAFAAISLKEPQLKNKEVEKKLNILLAVGKAQEAETVADKNSYVEQEYAKYIKESFLIDMSGKRIDGDASAAFNLDLKAALKVDETNRKVPVFVCEDGGKMQYIFPVLGTGLWGPVWGFVALEDDFNTISGATFDHKGETPGLGAEISTSEFQAQFKGKKIFDGTTFVAIKIVKPGAALNEHSVDGISGGTITSVGVEKTIFDCLSNYKKYFDANKKVEIKALPTPAVDSLGMPMIDSSKLIQ